MLNHPVYSYSTRFRFAGKECGGGSVRSIGAVRCILGQWYSRVTGTPVIVPYFRLQEQGNVFCVMIVSRFFGKCSGKRCFCRDVIGLFLRRGVWITGVAYHLGERAAYGRFQCRSALFASAVFKIIRASASRNLAYLNN